MFGKPMTFQLMSIFYQFIGFCCDISSYE